MIRTMLVGSRGCGKMETMRKNSGLSHNEFNAAIAETERQLKEASAYRKAQQKFWNMMWDTNHDE